MFAPLYIYSYVTGAMATLPSPRRTERGASFTEYVVLIGGVVAVVLAGMLILGPKINAFVTALDLDGP
jgi:Flp pilus assembly pilin Flp